MTAYHGSRVPVRRFDAARAATGVFWFSEDAGKVSRGESGGDGARWLMTCRLIVERPAGWDEYERYGVDELEALGFDSVHLDDDWVVFDASRVEVLEAKRT